jgi:hypothetical protein
VKFLFWEKGRYFEGLDDWPVGVSVSAGSDYAHAVDKRGMSHSRHRVYRDNDLYGCELLIDLDRASEVPRSSP